jgi:hypothetical protein
MNEELPAFVQSFNTSIRDAEVFISIARARELQAEACGAVESLLRDIASEKALAIRAANEDYANFLLGCECAASGVLAEIQMWLLLKDEKPDEAWNRLIDAQSSYTAAMRAHPGFRHLGEARDRLQAIEDLVFPPQVFISSGFIIRVQECSICGKEYEDCEHLVGRPYMGRFCYIIARNAMLDHVSIVDRPADKRCRITSFGTEGGNRNRMTWRIEPNEQGEVETRT